MSISVITLALSLLPLMRAHAQSRVGKESGAKCDNYNVWKDSKHIEQAAVSGYTRKQRADGRQSKLYHFSTRSLSVQSTYQGRETDCQNIRTAENVGSVQKEGLASHKEDGDGNDPCISSAYTS